MFLLDSCNLCVGGTYVVHDAETCCHTSGTSVEHDIGARGLASCACVEPDVGTCGLTSIPEISTLGELSS
jgi:hypothetical protein